MADSKKEVLPIKITAPEDLYYKYSCDKVIFDGWKILENSDNNSVFGLEEDTEINTIALELENILNIPTYVSAIFLLCLLLGIR